MLLYDGWKANSTLLRAIKYSFNTTADEKM